MLRAREGKMLTADRAGRMLEAQNFEECAKLLGDCGYEDMTGMNAGEIDAALSAHREAVFAELENLVTDSLQPPWTVAHQAPPSMEFSRHVLF